MKKPIWLGSDRFEALIAIHPRYSERGILAFSPKQSTRHVTAAARLTPPKSGKKSIAFAKTSAKGGLKSENRGRNR